MKLTLFLLGLVALATALPANNEDDEESNVFVRTFNVLHQEPPPPMIQSRATAETKRITQKVDNFDESDTRTWEMRYMENAEFYQPGGPLFIFVGGEWEISAGRVTGGHMYDMAKEHNGYLFYTEHRFYGDSKPLSDLSTENLRYLNVRQALADLAHFIRTMKSTINGMANSKVIIVGGSYSATMVTWFKREYPDLATGAWASSAPLLAKVNFVEYKEVTGESIRKVGGPACYERIHNAMTELETMFAHKQGAEVKAMLKLCSPFDENSELDLWNLFSEISDVFAGVVQTHNNGNIQGVCREILMEDSDVLGLAKYLLRKWNNPTGCNDLSYGTMLKTLRNTAYTKNIMRQWIYQTCNEYGWYQTSDSQDQPFGSSFPVEFYLQMCRDVYGDQFTSYFVHDQVVATNDHFGALKPDVKNVYITHGQLDPWSAMGIQEGELTTIIPNHAHCKDFDSISANDSWEMRQSKERIAQLVREWLAEP